MNKLIAFIYIGLFVVLALYFAGRPNPRAQGPYSFPNLTTNYLKGAP
jgi:hypothetical protein